MKANVPNTLRVLNKTLVLNLIRQNYPLSRAQIAKKANLTRSTISEIVQELLDENMIYEKGVDHGGLGRKGVLLHYNEDYGYVIGIDLGGTKISLGLVDFNGNLKHQKTVPTFQVTNNEVFIQMLVREIEKLIQETNHDPKKLRALGIASPGIIDYQNGVVLEGSPNLPQWENLSLRQIITNHFHVPVVIENDVRAGLIGEIWQGSCKNTQSAILLSLGTGIGSALLIDGKIVRGSHNAAGEIGYMLFSKQDLQVDWSDQGGRFESLASGPSFAKLYAERNPTSKNLSTPEIFQLAKSGDKTANQVIDDIVEHICIAILNVITMINPEKVIITGGVARSGELFLDKLREKVQFHTLHRTKVDIQSSKLYELAAIYGISILALSSLEPSIQFVEVDIC